MWEQGGRNPVLAAPGSKDIGGLIASSTTRTSGTEAEKVQVLSDEEAKLCEDYLPFAYKTAGHYVGKGIALDELRSASVIGLIKASQGHDPQRGPFGPYARHWCKGEITALFKEVKRHRAESLDAQLPNDRRDEPDKPRTLADKLAYAAPVGATDLRGLADVDRKIIQARDAGESLVEVGKAHGLSPERIRQREARARTRLKGMAAICLSDLTCRGEILPFPRRYSWGDASFRDTPPPKHAYREPRPSKQLLHHRSNANRLAAARGEPSAWGRKSNKVVRVPIVREKTLSECSERELAELSSEARLAISECSEWRVQLRKINAVRARRGTLPGVRLRGLHYANLVIQETRAELPTPRVLATDAPITNVPIINDPGDKSSLKADLIKTVRDWAAVWALRGERPRP